VPGQRHSAKCFYKKKKKKTLPSAGLGALGKIKIKNKKNLPSAGQALGKVTINGRWRDDANILLSALRVTRQNIKIFC
jgi:hypothetical protein